MYIIGRRPVIEALRSKKPITEILIRRGSHGGIIFDIKNLADKQDIPYIEVAPSNFDRKISQSNHQGVAAYVSNFAYASLEDILYNAAERKEEPFILLLDGITDPQNLGAVIRSAEAAGVHGIVIPKHHSARINETVHKTSAGAVNHIPIAQINNLAQTIDVLKKRNIWVFGAHQGAEYLCYDINLQGAVALIVGSEGRGIRKLVKEKCDQLIKIPMHGKIQSLNVSVSTAVLLFEIVRQKQSTAKKTEIIK